jgi:hypothetical protein
MSMGHGSFDTTMKHYTGVSADLQKQAAAVMWAATPMFTTFPGSEFGPLVVRWHSGLEHRVPTRFASTLLTGS